MAPGERRPPPATARPHRGLVASPRPPPRLGSVNGPSSSDQLRAALAALARERAFRELLQEALKTTYREMALRHHPDRGGSHEAMVAVNEMYERLNGLFQMRAVPST